MQTTLRRAVVALTLALGLVAAPDATASAAPSPAAWSPTGANDWSCQPTTRRPSPVVLVHGTFGDAKSLLDRISATLAGRGFCVFSLDYGNRATGPIEDSAAQLSGFVDRVLDATGAEKVSMVGHSQGGMMPRYYIKYLGGADKVDDLVGLAPSNHGTANPLALFPGIDWWCPACAQQQAGSDFLAGLNAGDETPGPVSYTTIVTRWDEVVIPYTSGFLNGATNVRILDKCWFDGTEHIWIPMDGPTIRVAINALERPGPADPGFRPSCWP